MKGLRIVAGSVLRAVPRTMMGTVVRPVVRTVVRAVGVDLDHGGLWYRIGFWPPWCRHISWATMYSRRTLVSEPKFETMSTMALAKSEAQA